MKGSSFIFVMMEKVKELCVAEFKRACLSTFVDSIFKTDFVFCNALSFKRCIVVIDEDKKTEKEMWKSVPIPHSTWLLSSLKMAVTQRGRFWKI